MTKQINTLVSTQWLLPLFNEQLNELHELWRNTYQNADTEGFVAIQSVYHNFRAALDVANLNIFEHLSCTIELFLQGLADGTIPIKQALIALYASELLQYELNSYAKTGEYQVELLLKRAIYLAQLLKRSGVDVSAIESDKAYELGIHTANSSNRFDADFSLDHIDIPELGASQDLSEAQLQSLVSVWRHDVQHLFEVNENNPETLRRLQKIAQYLVSYAATQGLKNKQALWYLTALWLEALSQNDEPKPSIYANILADLEVAIIQAQPELVRAAFSDIYIQLSSLQSITATAEALLQNIKKNLSSNKRFLPRLLDKLERLIFKLDTPNDIINPLQHIQAQLSFRGWYMYEQQIEQVLQELYAVSDMPDSYDSIRWMIERRLQELYGNILNSSEMIDTQIGQNQLITQPQVDVNLSVNHVVTDTIDNMEKQAEDATDLTEFAHTDGQQDSISEQLDKKSIRQVRIAMEDIKTAFSYYLQSQSLSDLPHADLFESLKQTFTQIELYDVVNVIDQCEYVFNEIAEYELTQLTWRLRDTIADGLAMLELFLDFLAQQTLDLELLNKALERFASARTALIELAEKPEIVQKSEVAQSIEAPSLLAASDVTRYDDTGEVTAHKIEADNINKPSTLATEESNTFDNNTAEGDVTDSVASVAHDDDTQIDIHGDIDSLFHDVLLDDNQPTADQKTADQVTDNQITDANIEAVTTLPAPEEIVETDTANLIDTPELQAARAMLKADSFDMDEEINEIFIEEAEEVLQALETYLPVWQDDLQDLTPLGEIRRGFHTLKGSGRMVGAYNAAELAWAVENLLNRVLDNTLPPSELLVDFIRETKSLIPTLIADFAQKREPSIDPAITIAKANNLLKGNPINQGVTQTVTNTVTVADSDKITDSKTIDKEIETNTAIQTDTVLDADLIKTNVDEGGQQVSSQAPDSNTPQYFNAYQYEGLNIDLPPVLSKLLENIELPKDDEEADEDIKEIFIEEAGEVLAELTPIFKQWRADHTQSQLLNDIRRGFHTLKGSGRMVGAFYTGELAWAIESMLNRVLDNTVEVVPDMESLIADVLQTYPHMVDIFDKGDSNYPSITLLWVACANAYSKGLSGEFNYEAIRADWLSITAENDKLIQDSVADSSTSQSASEQADATPEPSSKVLKSIQTANVKLASADLPTPTIDKEEWEFYEIFLEEAEELVAVIKDFINSNENADEIIVDDNVVRAFHTLRGATGSDSLKEVREISGAVEHSLKLLQQHEEPMSRSHLEVLEQSVSLIEQYISQFKHTAQDTELVDVDGAQDSNRIEEQQVVKQLFDASISAQKLDQNEFDIAQTIGNDVEDLLDAEWEVENYFNGSEAQFVEYAQLLQQQIVNLSGRVAQSATFMTLLTALHGVYTKLEAEPNIRNLNKGSQSGTVQDNATQEQQQHNRVLNILISGHEALTQLFDALAGSMSLQLDDTVIADLHTIAESTPLEALLKEAQQNTIHDTSGSASTDDNVSTIASDTQPTSKKVVPALVIEPINTDVELLEIFLEEAQELDESIHETFAQWRLQPEDLDTLKVLQRHLHTVKGGARMAGISSIGDITHEAETIYELFVKGVLNPTQEWVDVMQRVQDVLSQQIDYAVNHHESFFANALVKQLKQFAKDAKLPDKVELDIPVITLPDEEAIEPISQDDDQDEQLPDNKAIDSKFQTLVASSWGGTYPDEDILSVFLEEAIEIVESSAEYLNTFRSNTSDLSVLSKLQRDLHTMKGGARMVPANGIADLAHQMETVYEDLASRRRPPTKMVGQLLEACHDWLSSAVLLLKYKINPPLPSKLIEALKRFSKNPDSLNSVRVDSLLMYQELIKEHEATLNARVEQYNIDQPPPIAGSFSKSKEQSSLSTEMIRIPAALMERMINLSGESAINRARIDMGVASLTHTIEEMGMTVQRLADQLRRMDIELEAQILAQIDDEELLGKADFDPLEMDQYSSLNQLSKSLSESASDLLDIKTTMLDKTRDSEALLLQLSRTQAELQDGLMDSRMVPFSRLAPRLQRIVRQTANELNKSVELKIINADDEMDRTILERITSPLEHMLRNAVDHGIELPKERELAGKSPTGLIVLEVLREGSEVVIHLSDDGYGINVDAVRKKAISQGLIDPNDTSLTDLDVMQYIFNAGLTTTSKVTQISGRGVGMDVVLNEIRQLGGIVSVESKRNEGSRFSMRVPLTVAISDALIVRVADSYYAIPLVQIERVVRVNPERLYDFYKSGETSLEIDGKDYRLRYLNEILRGKGLNELAVHTNLSLPVIIVKNQTDQQLAIQVDEVAGSRIEVVVKPLGRQLSHASGISAATIMADGSVMLILDLMALLRNAPAISQSMVHEDKTKGTERKTILIVDDSVTVRKVTSRLLERQGYATQVAKDGIDAIEILQELTPDLMLLDIEMPRMDGFEVATQVRHDSRLENIPIIMITSRTGDKHRDRALEVGVNDYMGKPYQEAQLLQTVENLLGQSVHD